MNVGPEAFEVVRHVVVEDLGDRDGQKLDLAGDSRADQLRAPVPAEHVLRLAHERARREVEVGLLAVRTRAVAQICRRLRLSEAQRGVQLDLHLVFALAEKLGDIEAPRPEVVVGRPQQLAVEKHSRERVDAMEDQVVPPAPRDASRSASTVSVVL